MGGMTKGIYDGLEVQSGLQEEQKTNKEEPLQV
jgi:hypothetical protein